MAGWVFALALLQAASGPPVDEKPLAGSLPPLDAPDDRGPERVRQRGPLFISPMGEPFRGNDPVARWFAGADTNHDGVVTQAEFVADADRFFLVLDRAHDGEIDPQDIEYYETVLAPEIRTGGGGLSARGTGRGAKGGGRGGRGGGHGGGRRGGGGDGGGEGAGGEGASGGETEQSAVAVGTYDAQAQGAARYGFFDYPEPVTAADANLNRGVDIREFRNAAERRFALLDKRNDGRLTRDELPRLSATPGGPDRKRPGGPSGGRGGHRGGGMPPRDPGE